VIFAFDLIEHIYNFPLFLEKCSKLLAHDGCLILLTGDIDCIEAKQNRASWQYVRIVEHIIFPSKKAYELNGWQVCEFLTVFPWYEPEFTIRGRMRRCIRAISKSYKGWPFSKPNHYMVILKQI
jgi:hypothetical protein